MRRTSPGAAAVHGRRAACVAAVAGTALSETEPRSCRGGTVWRYAVLNSPSHVSRVGFRVSGAHGASNRFVGDCPAYRCRIPLRPMDVVAGSRARAHSPGGPDRWPAGGRRPVWHAWGHRSRTASGRAPCFATKHTGFTNRSPMSQNTDQHSPSVPHHRSERRARTTRHRLPVVATWHPDRTESSASSSHPCGIHSGGDEGGDQAAAVLLCPREDEFAVGGVDHGPVDEVGVHGLGQRAGQHRDGASQSDHV